MGSSSTLRNAGFIVSNLFLFSYHACKEGAAHDRYTGCVISFDETFPPPPPFLGFEYWTSVGVALALFGIGVLVGTIQFVLRSDEAADNHLLSTGSMNHESQELATQRDL
jgi:hypothetical protein